MGYFVVNREGDNVDVRSPDGRTIYAGSVMCLHDLMLKDMLHLPPWDSKNLYWVKCGVCGWRYGSCLGMSEAARAISTHMRVDHNDASKQVAYETMPYADSITHAQPAPVIPKTIPVSVRADLREMVLTEKAAMELFSKIDKHLGTPGMDINVREITVLPEGCSVGDIKELVKDMAKIKQEDPNRFFNC